MEGRMWPIRTGNKARRIKWGPPQNQISWAYTFAVNSSKVLHI